MLWRVKIFKKISYDQTAGIRQQAAGLRCQTLDILYDSRHKTVGIKEQAACISWQAEGSRQMADSGRQQAADSRHQTAGIRKQA